LCIKPLSRCTGNARDQRIKNRRLQSEGGTLYGDAGGEIIIPNVIRTVKPKLVLMRRCTIWRAFST